MLDAIAAWELDAALEAPQRYVLRTDAIARIAAGEASVVVGTRGGGKTAAARLIVAESSPERPAARIAMKDAFLAALRPLADGEGRARASASARYLMLLAAFEAMLAGQILQGSEIRELARTLAVALHPSIREALPHAFSKGLLFEIFGDGSDVRGDVEEQILSLEHAVANALGRRRALVLFDETADRSVVAGAFDALRVDALRILLTGLRDLRAGPARDRVVPVVFARPGLYARLPDQDRALWRNRRLVLAWSSRDLRAAAAHRLARSRNARAAGGASDGLALQRFFIDAGRGGWVGEGPSWNMIMSRTRARPRDMVFFIRAVARSARHRNLRRVDAEALRLGEITYAAYLRQDMADEIRDAAPDVDDLLAAIARYGKQRMSARELVELVERTLADVESEEAVAGARAAIERFYKAAAIGNWRAEGGRGGRDVFIYDFDPDATLDYHAPVVIHPGLASALGLELERAA
jgi:hypothetical protein